MFDVIIGALIAGLFTILGIVIGQRIQARNARQIRMDEIYAEKKVNANAEAYARIKTIASMLVQSSTQETLEKMSEYEEWFFSTRLFLPGKYPNKWLTIRNNLRRVVNLQQRMAKSGSQDTADEITNLEEKMDLLAEEAIQEIYKEMELSSIRIEST